MSFIAGGARSRAPGVVRSVSLTFGASPPAWLVAAAEAGCRSLDELGAASSLEQCGGPIDALRADPALLAEYGRWLLDYDMTGPYRFYRQTLQLLAHRRGEARFLLKCPEHLWFVDSLLEVFPDARIVWTHRDPVASVASYCSLISLGQRMLYGRFDPLKLGQHIQSRFREGVERAMQARQRAEALGKGDQFFDVDFTTLVRDPPAVVRQIKEWADMPHDKASEARVQRWMNTERGDKKGAHKYSAEVYGLDGHAIHREYADYIDRFDIPLKPLD